MLTLGRGGRVFLVAGPTDMRKSFDGLSGVVRAALGDDPQSGDWPDPRNESGTYVSRFKERVPVLA